MLLRNYSLGLYHKLAFNVVFYCSHVRFSFYEQLLCVLLVCVLGLVLRAVIRATPMLPHCPALLSLFSVVVLYC